MELQARCRRRILALSIGLSHDVGRVEAHRRADWPEFPFSQPWKLAFCYLTVSDSHAVSMVFMAFSCLCPEYWPRASEFTATTEIQSSEIYPTSATQ